MLQLSGPLDADRASMERIQFLFFSLDEGEPPHVQVSKGAGQAEFWLAGCRLAKARAFADHELRLVQKKVREHREELLRAWHEHFEA
jgi:Domain of unknown function (DUF4160)